MIFLIGQLQQENSPIQLWQSEQPEYPCEHQRVHVNHRHHQDRRGRPRLHPQVSTGAWMVSRKMGLKRFWQAWQQKGYLHLSTFPPGIINARYDYRIKYFNLKKTRSQNALALEDVHRLWIPFLVFDNTEKNEATKVFCLCTFHGFTISYLRKTVSLKWCCLVLVSNHFQFRGQRTQSWPWPGRATSLGARMTT